MRGLMTISFVVVMSFAYAQDNNTAVSFTLGDRDRLMRNEQNLISLQKEVNTRFESLQKEMNSRFESLQKEMNIRFEGVDTRFESIDVRFKSIDRRFDAQQKQLDNIFTLMLFLLGGIMGLIGFVIYDRRTAIKPVQREQELIINVLKEYSKKNNDLKEILKKAGIIL